MDASRHGLRTQEIEFGAWRCCICCAVVADAHAVDLAQRVGAEKLLFIGDAIGAADIKGRL